MGFFHWINRLAGKPDRKAEPTAVALVTQAQNAPIAASNADVAEIQKDEAEET
jgi:hypothetical protein